MLFVNIKVLNNMKIAGAILAGGKSSRMGKNKAMLNFKGEALINNAVRLLKFTEIDKIYISGSVIVSGVESIPDGRKDLGPIGGICSVLEHCLGKYDYLLVIPVDMPLLDKNSLKEVIEKCDKYEMSYYDQYYFPICIKISGHIVNLLSEIIRNNNNFSVSLRKVIDMLNSNKIVAIREKEYFKNINTVNDWNNLIKNESKTG